MAGTSPGLRVSDSLGLPERARGIRQLRETLAAIDRVHCVGPLPWIQVEIRSQMPQAGRFLYNPLGGVPLGIALRRGNSSKRLTLAHEVGHFLDYSAIGQPNRFETTARAIVLAGWRQAVMASTSVQRLLRLRGARPSSPRIGGHIHTGCVRYPATDVELWARSYAQYVALRGRDAALLDELDAARARGAGVDFAEQWDDDDFAPIAHAIDELFERLGWRR
ncbi:MAG: hypothetical protein AVDCRST_MAG88-2113 [uncultured Thermomicrobiales bacterium]|uniref:IrrE N-terminal-like domain-containing protein n=1 Tax=uncultured Thermomicrobiales bacterium TaxID=1645740 RepID=A0A6J4V6Q5_9BACT|nr:MAG: hypothetical protein AVDCRST_MAG88-2113 [uncultured Thermomicrobiales bacterium]